MSLGLSNKFQTVTVRQLKKYFKFIHWPITLNTNIRPNITTHIEIIVKIYKHQTIQFIL